MTRYGQLMVGVCLVGVLSACATLPQPEPAAPTGISANIAVQNLYDQAAAHYHAGDSAQAYSTIERAVRIEPGNPHLWFELAQLANRDGEKARAKELAFRAQSLAGTDTPLRGSIQQFIDQLDP